MGMDRRKFIKVAAVAAVGLAKGESALAEGHVGGEQKTPLVGKRWAMVIDLKKCNEAEGCVELAVRDQGVGIPRAQIERLCDPFFTTKQENGGTGLGLAITYALVREHNGDMVFESEPGKGLTVRVRLPISDRESDFDTRP